MLGLKKPMYIAGGVVISLNVARAPYQLNMTHLEKDTSLLVYFAHGTVQKLIISIKMIVKNMG